MRKLQLALATLAAFALSTRGMAQAAPKPDSAALANRYRFRLLGVYDATTGDPIEGVVRADVWYLACWLSCLCGWVCVLFLGVGGLFGVGWWGVFLFWVCFGLWFRVGLCWLWGFMSF